MELYAVSTGSVPNISKYRDALETSIRIYQYTRRNIP